MIYTIGFTKKSAEDFFSRLKDNDVKKIIDVRLNNSSQLAGFSKGKDLKYFLKEICGIEYSYEPDLAPTKDILDAYKKYKGDWKDYEVDFMELMYKRNIEKIYKMQDIEGGCLLCSEDKPHFCHRRLVLEYLQKSWNIELDVNHIY